MNNLELKSGSDKLTVKTFDQDKEIEIVFNDEFFYLSPNQTNDLIKHLTTQLKSINEFNP